VTQAAEEVTSKRLELLHEFLSNAGVLALLVNPTAPELAEPQAREALSAAQVLGVKLHVLNASTEQDFDRVFAKLTELRAGGLVIGGSAFFTSHLRHLAALTVQHAVPAIYQWREFAAAGGLMSYGADIIDMHRLVGIYAGRILKGDKPANLPVAAGDQSPDVHQLEDRPCARHHHSSAAIRPCRRGFRVIFFAALHESGLTRTGRKKVGRQATQRWPSSEMPPPGTIMCTCG
jgi:hypothetical protein